MRFLLAILLTALLAFVLGLYFDWWSIAVASFLVALLLVQRPGLSFLAAFIALFLMWGTLALWINYENGGLMATRIAKLLPLGGSSILLVIVTSFIGGLVAGLAAMTASYLRVPPLTVK